LTAGIALAWLLVAVACSSCTPRAEPPRGDGNTSAAHASSDASATTTTAPPVTGASETRGGASAGALDFTLVNFTRFNLHAIYVSPHDSSGWEENILGRDLLLDGTLVKIRFSPAEQTVRWDLRVEDENGNSAEWKNLDLREISKITLRFNKGVVSAEAE
jgi:hypothetical protein